MTVEQVRQLYNAAPFRPFIIHLADGRQIPVKHREFMAISPSGRTIVVYQTDDTSNIIDLLLVTDVKPESGCREKSEAGKEGAMTQARNPPEPTETGNDNTARKLSILNDLYVDLLGSLVPGLFTVILGGTLLVLTLSTVHKLALGQAPVSTQSLDTAKPLIESLHTELAVITLVSAYVIGSVFFRQDPKKPDEVSALYVWMKSTQEERLGLAVQSGSKSKESPQTPFPWADRLRAFVQPRRYMKMYDLDTQFPYPHLKCYLGARGLTHLTSRIPWCPKDEDFDTRTKKFRTKMFINTLKIRLHSLTPHLCRDIVRNEAHVRLATSVWYASTWILSIAIVCLALLFAGGIMGWGWGWGEKLDLKQLCGDLYAPAAMALLLILLCLAMKRQLRKCIHYMRVREVVYVLEASHIASRQEPSFRIDELTEKDPSNKCVQCDRIRGRMHLPHWGLACQDAL